MPRPRLYANNGEKMKAYRANRDGRSFKVVNGYVTVDRGLKVTPKVTRNKVTVTNQQIKEPPKMMDRVHKATHTELIISVLKTKVNRGISNERLYALAEFVVDTIYKDCRGY